jgi:hypothetical protein
MTYRGLLIILSSPTARVAAARIVGRVAVVAEAVRFAAS